MINKKRKKRKDLSDICEKIYQILLSPIQQTTVKKKKN